MQLPIVTDPWFYVVSVPAVLLLGISKSGFGAGFGSLAVPIMALAVSVPQAAAVLMPVLLVMDLLGLAAFRRHFDPQLLKFLLPWGLGGVLVGAVLFKVLDAHVIAALVGGFTLLFLAQRLLFPPRPDSPPPPPWMGKILTVLSGFTSFIAHSGSPPLNVYVIPMRLPVMTYTATMAFFYFFVNVAKWVPYGLLGLLDLRNMATSVVLLPLAPLGVWLGIRIARKISQELFYKLLYIGMFFTGVKLLWDGFA